ncbi:MAG TPA: PAS domain S-box protein [Armatimonadota bacterium]
MSADRPSQRAQRKITELEISLRLAHDDINVLRQSMNVCPCVIIRWMVSDTQVNVSVVGGIHYLAQFGYQADEMYSGQQQWMHLIMAEDRARVMADILRHAHRHDSQYLQSYRIHTGTGDVRWVEEHATAINDPQGELLAFQACVFDITERRIGEEQLYTILESLPVGVWTIDRDGHVTHGNPAAHMIWNAPDFSGELLGYKGWWADTGQPLTQTDWASYRAVTTGETILNEEIKIETYDGQRKVILNSAIPLRDQAHHIIGAIVVNQDITKRKRAEEALRASEQRLATIIETAVVGLVIHAADGTVTRSNSTAQQLLGITGEQMQGKAIDDPVWHFIREDGAVLPVEEYPAAKSLTSRQAVRNYVVGIRSPHTRQTTWVVANAIPLLDTHGAVSEVIVTFMDITEQKRIEHEREVLLAEVNRRAAELDATIAAMADGVIIYDNDLEILRMNVGAERILGYTPAQMHRPLAERLIASHFRTSTGAQVLPGEFPAVRAVAGEIVRGVIYSLTRQDGREFWVSLSAAPIRRADTVIGAVVTFADITAFHQLQQRQAELLHIVSHDLRLPLTIIQGHAQLIEEACHVRRINGDLALSLSTILRNVQRMNVMIQDLVEIARLEGKQLILQCESVALDQYLPDLLRRVAEILPVHRVHTHLAPHLPPIWADYARLERMLLNLLSNALKYAAPETPVEITVTQQGDEVVIAVTDYGHGIAPEDVPHIFERFYRMKGERKAEGVGLGLYITKMLTEAHGGRIWVESTVGTGSTFFVTLPLAKNL